MRDWWRSLTIPQVLLIGIVAVLLFATVSCGMLFAFSFAYGTRSFGGSAGPMPTPVVITETPSPAP